MHPTLPWLHSQLHTVTQPTLPRTESAEKVSQEVMATKDTPSLAARRRARTAGSFETLESSQAMNSSTVHLDQHSPSASAARSACPRFNSTGQP